MIEYECPKCRNPMTSPESMGGKTETCPECKADVRVPIECESLDKLAEAAALPRATRSRKIVETPTATESTTKVLGALLIVLGAIVAPGGVIVIVLREQQPIVPNVILAICIGLQCVVSGVGFYAIGHGLRYLRRIAGGR